MINIFDYIHDEKRINVINKYIAKKIKRKWRERERKLEII